MRESSQRGTVVPVWKDGWESYSVPADELITEGSYVAVYVVSAEAGEEAVAGDKYVFTK